MQEKSKGFDNKIISLLICAILAICLWCYVSFVENPDMSRWISDIPVSLTGETKLHERGLGLYKVEIQGMDLKIKAKRSQFLDLFDSSITAVADVSAITEPGTYSIQAKAVMPSAISASSISDRRNDTVVVVVENYETKVFKLEPNIVTQPKDGFFVYSSFIDTAEDGLNISVSGCSSVLENVSRISTTDIDLGNATEDVVYPVSFTAFDENGKEIKDIQFNTQKRSINFTLYKSTVIPVTIELSGDDPKLVSECVDSNISVMGPPEKVDTLTSLTVRINEYNYIAGQTASVMLNLPADVKITNKATNEVEIKFSEALAIE